MDLAAVADGRIDLWCQHSAAEWDWMPGFALVEGAGGVVAHLEVRGIAWSLAGAPSAVATAAELLRSA
jgi:fructose-1,6-bisphosphatase/inositol monophosphatase family enzyme